MGWWLFHYLEQGIEALGGNHVSLIEDKDFEAVAGWGKECSFTKVTGIINTVVRSSVNFNYIQ
jgi:hypothetical protein